MSPELQAYISACPEYYRRVQAVAQAAEQTYRAVKELRRAKMSNADRRAKIKAAHQDWFARVKPLLAYEEPKRPEGLTAMEWAWRRHRSGVSNG